MKKILSLLFILSFNVSYAGFDDIGFYQLFELPQENYFKDIESIYNKVLRLDTKGGSCSASLISNEGHVLTALHCISGCFSKDDSEYIQDTGVVMLSNIQGKECNLKLETYDYNLVGNQAKIISHGKGWSEFAETDIPSFSDEQVALVKSLTDFAILKYESLKDEHKSLCLKTGDNQNLKDNKIWAIGYPGMTNRFEVPQSDGKTNLISYGSIINDVTQNDFYKMIGFNEEHYEKARKIYLNDKLILSDMDLYSGNSGSPSFNSDGLITGVNVALASSSAVAKNYYYKGTASTLKIDLIKKETKNQIKKTKGVFSCE